MQCSDFTSVLANSASVFLVADALANLANGRYQSAVLEGLAAAYLQAREFGKRRDDEQINEVLGNTQLTLKPFSPNYQSGIIQSPLERDLIDLEERLFEPGYIYASKK